MPALLLPAAPDAPGRFFPALCRFLRMFCAAQFGFWVMQVLRAQLIFFRMLLIYQGGTMATKKKRVGTRKYGNAAGKSVKSAVHREKRGTLKSGKGGRGGTVKSRKQAIAIGLSEARKKGAKVPKKKAA
jgi:hypothetical protein